MKLALRTRPFGHWLPAELRLRRRFLIAAVIASQTVVIFEEASQLIGE